MTKKYMALLVLFSALLLSLFAIPHVSGRVDPWGAQAKYGFYLEESARRLGIDFVHEGPQFDPRLENLMPWLTAWGASVSVTDVNNDGWPDLYVTNSRIGSKNRLYLNRKDGTFVEVAEKAGVADVNLPDTGVSTGAAWADYDNDGDEDLLLFKFGYLELFRNNGDLTFTRVTTHAGLENQWIYAADTIWWDFNLDGCLDIYVSAYFRPEPNFWRPDTSRIMMDDMNRSRNGGRNKLYVSRCDGSFTEESERYGLDDSGWTFASGAADLDGNGFPDLYVANDFGRDSLFLNVDGSRFTKVIDRYGIGDDTKKGMNVSFGDFKNTGRLGVYVTNITKRGFLVEGNMLWENLGGGRFRDVAWEVGAADGAWGWGGQFGDLNNDGHLDIYTVNGFISAGRSDYWYDMGTMGSSASFVLEDVAYWPPIGTKSFSGYEPSRVLLNDGRGRFQDVARSVSATDLLDGRGVALVDLDRNGSLDVVVANQRGQLLVYRNHVDPKRKWVAFRLQGTRSNRSAIHTQLALYWDDKKQVQEVGVSGYAGKGEKLLHFGLGDHPTLHRAEIRWPSGKTQVLRDLAPNQVYAVAEP